MHPDLKYKIPNNKQQISNKSQISIFNDQNLLTRIEPFGGELSGCGYRI